jgi:hypothetical protein
LTGRVSVKPDLGLTGWKYQRTACPWEPLKDAWSLLNEESREEKATFEVIEK